MGPRVRQTNIRQCLLISQQCMAIPQTQSCGKGKHKGVFHSGILVYEKLTTPRPLTFRKRLYPPFSFSTIPATGFSTVRAILCLLSVQTHKSFFALIVQVICDVIQSGGIIGGPYISLQQQINEPVELVFCNPDLIWRSDFPRPRLGQGAFKEAFQAVYKARRVFEGPDSY